ncbi:MAG: acyl-CoA thioesterase [Pseudomonadota bacterium]
MPVAYHIPLSPEAQAELGVIPPAPLAMADQVRFSELDVLNHVNNAIYMAWFERLRVKYTQLWGLSRYRGSGEDPRIVIRSGTIHYREEMRMDETYVVTCRCLAYRNTSFTVAQQLWADRRLRATLDCVLVLLTADGSQRYPIPNKVVERFRELDSAKAEATHT